MEKNEIQIYHNIPISGDHFACVAFGARNDYVSISTAKSSGEVKSHQCALRISTQLTKLPESFDQKLDNNKLSSIISIILASDGQAMKEFHANRQIQKRVPIHNPQPQTLMSASPDLSDYHRVMKSSGELIRPIMLATPNLEYLRQFQIRGVEWLTQNKKGILADDMGLGKTPQAISALRLLVNMGLVRCALVICPKSLITNWETELSKWAPELSRLRLVPSSKIHNEVWSLIFNKVHVILTNYEQMRKPPDILLENDVDLIIADEAHRIRKIGSLAANGIRQIKPQRFWALTGTPIEKDVSDLVALLSTIEPMRFSLYDKSLHPSSLRAQSRPYILRRLKSEVLTELPDVLLIEERLELLPKQRKSYNATIRKMQNTGEKDVLSIINQLRMICDYDERTNESAKAERIIERIQDILKLGEKVVVFSYLLKPLEILQDKIAKNLGPSISTYLHGALSSDERDEVLKRFKIDPDVTVLLCSSKLGGEGLTLTEANHVIFFNEWWNPSANAQARDRVIRIGQNRIVQIYRFICRETIEENLEIILQDKSQTMIEMIDRMAESLPDPINLEPILKRIKLDLLSNDQQ